MNKSEVIDSTAILVNYIMLCFQFNVVIEFATKGKC